MIGHKIIWLASYPKSGNTWMRALLTNYDSRLDHPVDINQYGFGWLATARRIIDEYLGAETSDMTLDEIYRYLPRAQEYFAADLVENLYVKTHAAFLHHDCSEPVFSPMASLGAIYIIRNPLDVAVSFAHHNATTIDKIVSHMNNPEYFLNGPNHSLYAGLPEKLLDWSGHAHSWVDQTSIPVHVVRYEDMLADTVDALRGVVIFANEPVDDEHIRQAVAFSRFEELQQQESEKVFEEKMPRAESFFREGKSGTWRAHLSDTHVAELIAAHGPMMRRFNYLDSRDEPVY